MGRSIVWVDIEDVAEEPCGRLGSTSRSRCGRKDGTGLLGSLVTCAGSTLPSSAMFADPSALPRADTPHPPTSLKASKMAALMSAVSVLGVPFLRPEPARRPPCFLYGETAK